MQSARLRQTDERDRSAGIGPPGERRKACYGKFYKSEVFNLLVEGKDAEGNWDIGRWFALSVDKSSCEIDRVVHP